MHWLGRDWSIGELSKSIADGDFSAVEVTTAVIARCEMVDPQLNAFIEISRRDALLIADGCDKARARGESLGPLHGVPFAFKDMFDVPGRRATFGSRLPAEEMPTEPAEIVAHIEEAGGVTMGFLNMSEFALGPTGHNASFGHCRNPWNVARISGGSSSGAAAAVAAGIVPGTIGSDTGGSIRIPASCCGVVGLKTTQDRVSASGALPLSPSLDCFGPLARTAQDCALVFCAMTGAAEKDPDGSLPALKDPPAARLVYPRGAVETGASGEIVAAIERALGEWERLGTETTICPAPNIEQAHELAATIQKFESAVTHAHRLANARDQYSPPVLRRIEGPPPVSSSAYREALAVRQQHQCAFLENILGDADAIVLPTIARPVPLIAETDEEILGALPDLVFQMTRWTRWLNYLGLPAVSLPCGYDSNGLPIGLQLAGRPESELQLLGIAHRFQSATDWHRRMPPVSARSLADL